MTDSSTASSASSAAFTAYFVALGDGRYEPTVHAGGAWQPGEIHFGPLGGLIAHVIEQHVADRADAELQLARISFDILGFLAAETVSVSVETLRPGRSIELVEATATIGGRAVVRARAWHLAAFDTRQVAGGAGEALTPPDASEPYAFGAVWQGGFVASLDARAAVTPAPGRGAVWLATDLRLVDGEDASPLAAWIALVDTANGIAVRESPSEWMFPNVDLTVHFHRLPHGRWVGLDTTVVFGADGLGITGTTLHDESGPVGFAQQSLTIRKLRP